MKWIRRGAWALLWLALIVAVALWIYSRRVLPTTQGTITLQSGPKSELRIERDADGIPTIKAASRDDAFFGLGYVHAQDRLWQLETHKRIASGRLSEAFGESALETDKFLRALGVRRMAAQQWEQVSAEGRAALNAYAAGINAYVQNELSARPPEFMLTGVQPEPWVPEDSMGWATMMAWDLGANWSGELLRLRMALQMPVERIQELLPPYPGEKPLATADYAALYRGLKLNANLGQTALSAAPESGIEGVGSNNWVVHGSHTESGKPLLANDPHLKLTAPALWYFARLEAPGFKVAGATMPGLPMVVLGQNQHVAWGFTNTGPDVQDLYIERVNPDDANEYQTPEGWAKFSSVTETIKVRGGNEVTLTARSTRHGPVISDVGGVTEGIVSSSRPAYVLAMRWTALDKDSGTLDAALAFNSARSVPEFIAAAGKHLAPMQNMVVADVDGHIGMVSAGRVPVRKPENDLKGLVPAPGWDSRYDWAGVLEPTWTPRETDPPRGWIATANQRIHPADYPHFLTSEWAAPYRQQRIEQLLNAKPKHSLASLQAMQADLVSLGTQRLLPFLRKAQSQHALAGAAQKELASFDGTMAADKAAPLIAWAWARQLTVGIFRDEVGAAQFDKLIATRSFREALEGALDRNDAWWCDDKGTPAQESCQDQIDAAFTRALDELQAAQGADVSKWQWGKAHQARSEHRPFSRVKLLAKYFELRTPVGGDTYTVNVSRVSQKPDATTGELYLDEHGPSFRAVYDLADPGKSRFMHSTGQSGIVFSPQYRSFMDRWREVQGVPVWASEPAKRALVLKSRAS
ncbi:penicillin acylase family protein [Piscinibacter gummiphilus]|uniref:Penicillin acylase family protein n=1 Tax=Piscinibacter gummiphilus TaxID=946333 RepID=A0ABZ0CZW9_9BURK|nr:penicillin acylase family protein [Piscinibacter gummiphilus]WOB10486.1 penicillin acylase family protein [Piscinibacter gummiphilus]